MRKKVIHNFINRLRKSNKGFLLPTVLALGISISLISIYALGVVTGNSNVLQRQTYEQLAYEAAQAGASAANVCAKTQSSLWTSPLVPNSDCSGSTSGTTKSAYVYSDASKKLSTAYSVAVPMPAVSGATVFTSTGTVVIDGSVVHTKVTKSLVKVALTATADTVAATVNVARYPDPLVALPNGSKVYVLNTSSGTVSVISTASNTVTATLTVGTSTGLAMAVSPDGKRVYASTDYLQGKVAVIDTTSDTVLTTYIVGRGPQTIAVSTDGSRVYTSNYGNNSVSVINTVTGAVTTIGISSGTAAGTNPYSLVLSPDGSRIYVSNYNTNTVSVINTSTNAVIATIPVGSAPRKLQINHSGSMVYVPNYLTNNISVISTGSNSVVRTFPVGSGPREIAISTDDTLVYVTNGSTNTLSVIDAVNNTVSSPITVGTNPWGLVLSNDGSKVYVANPSSNNVSVINTGTKTLVSTLSVGAGPRSMIRLPNTNKIYLTNNSSFNNSTFTVSVISGAESGSTFSSVTY